MPVPLLKKIGTHTTLTNVSSGLPEIICWFVTVLASNAHSFEILECTNTHTQLPCIKGMTHLDCHGKSQLDDSVDYTFPPLCHSMPHCKMLHLFVLFGAEPMILREGTNILEMCVVWDTCKLNPF